MRQADIAVRVIAALGAALLLLLFCASISQRYCNPNHAPSHYAGYGENSDQEGRNSPDWWCIAERFVSAEDSLAQWLLTVFSLFAVLVSGYAVHWVKKTFDATMTMAADTRRIGEAQVRAYIYLSGAEIDPVANTLDVLFKNYGSSPGTVTFVDCFVDVSDMYPHKNIWDQRFWSDGFAVAPQDTHRQKFRLDTGRAEFLQRMIAEEGIRTVVQGNYQFLDVFRHTHAHHIHIVLADGIRR